MATNYMAVYFPETLEFSTMRDERKSGYVGKRLFITYDDRLEPYEGIVKGVYKSEEEAIAMIEKWTNVDEMTLRYLMQRKKSNQNEASQQSTCLPEKETSNGNNDIFEQTSEIAKRRAERRSKLIKKKK